MSGNKAVLDSNAIIYASKGLVDVAKMLSRYDESYVSIITLIEVYAYDFPNTTEKDIVDEIISGLNIVDLDRLVADLAIIYRKNSTKKIKVPDAVILATANSVGADLITNDIGDFAGLDAGIRIVGLDGFWA